MLDLIYHKILELNFSRILHCIRIIILGNAKACFCKPCKCIASCLFLELCADLVKLCN